jgi:hypothetical protein
MTSVGVGFSPSATGTSGFTTGGIGFGNLIPGIGRPIYVKNNSNNRIEIGGGIKGRMPQPIVDHDNTDQFARTRFTLRDAWNTTSYSGSSYKNKIISSFRAVNNAGDLLCRQNYSVGGSCQTPQSRPGQHGLRQRFGASNNVAPSVVWSSLQINPSVPPSTCNVKYVYDCSDFTRYSKNKAINQNYNDLSFGGNQNSGSQVAWRASRRY